MKNKKTPHTRWDVYEKKFYWKWYIAGVIVGKLAIEFIKFLITR